MADIKKQIPVADNIFTWAANDPRLIVTKCQSCGTVMFPRTRTCFNPNCKDKRIEDVLLSNKGKLKNYTIQYYQPPQPYPATDSFRPFGIGLAEFPEGVAVIGQITGCDLDQDLKIGMDVETVLEKLYDDEQGNEVVGWKFKPILPKKKK